MVIVGYDHNGTIISILNAKSQELANAYWQGAGISIHRSRSLDDKETFMPLDESPTGVYPILKTKEIDVQLFGRNSKTVRIIEK